MVASFSHSDTCMWFLVLQMTRTLTGGSLTLVAIIGWPLTLAPSTHSLEYVSLDGKIVS